MDPDANLREQLELAEGILEMSDDETDHAQRIAEDADRLAELVIALHEWIKGGGFLPREWHHGP